MRLPRFERSNAMRRRLALFGAGTLACSLLATGIAAGGSDITSPQTLRFVAKYGQNRLIDNPPSGESLGDEFIGSGVLYQNGRRVGMIDGNITFTHVKPAHLEYWAGLKLRGGQVSLLGVVPEALTVTRFLVPVAGGTGIYDNARGQMRVVRRSGRSDYLTLYLEP
jgi:hypothetical protein